MRFDSRLRGALMAACVTVATAGPALAQKSADALGVARPPGGTFLFVDVKKYLHAGETDATGFLERCVEAGVLLTPGQASGKDYPTWVRLCFTTVPPAELDEALAKLATVMR